MGAIFMAHQVNENQKVREIGQGQFTVGEYEQRDETHRGGVLEPPIEYPLGFVSGDEDREGQGDADSLCKSVIAKKGGLRRRGSGQRALHNGYSAFGNFCNKSL